VVEPAVEVRGLSKRFFVHHDRSAGGGPLARLLRRGRSVEEFWALRDVSFCVAPGSAFGIVGENGSGKSTLLKLVAGLLRPTHGRLAVRGRLVGLLELGTGFHPDLTGRENIFLNASLLGLGRRETERRLDAIVDLAGIDRFVDTPLKHYSSGMQVRLGFAVAMHTDPDVLVTDEVLAVGDEAFQRQCFERIEALLRRGTTVLFVSHSLELVRRLCAEAVWLDRGEAKASGPSAAVVDAYLAYADARDRERRSSALPGEPPPDGKPVGHACADEVEITAVELLDGLGRPSSIFETDGPMCVRVRYVARRPIERAAFRVTIHHGDHLELGGIDTRTSGHPIGRLDGPGCVDCRIKALPLLRGSYAVSVGIYDQHGIHALAFRDRLRRFYVEQRRTRELYGVVWMDAEWAHRADRLAAPTAATPIGHD
jgi:ABC-type polysaccharide/polyol phosphate transport system ATPase subunit